MDKQAIRELIDIVMVGTIIGALVWNCSLGIRLIGATVFSGFLWVYAYRPWWIFGKK